jgi:tRNA1(Val) A37 N6-methylase TrmN6
MSMRFARPSVKLVHTWWAARLRKGDVVVDATCGRGFDSLQLAGLVLPSTRSESSEAGWLHCIDIQQEAIESTKLALLEGGFTEKLSFHLQSHQEFPSVIVPGTVAAVVYNLGYLPQGSKNIISKPATTITSLMSASKLLKPNGFISIMAYRGHCGGSEEYDSIKSYLATLSTNVWKITHFPSSANPLSPVLILLDKHKSE